MLRYSLIFNIYFTLLLGLYAQSSTAKKSDNIVENDSSIVFLDNTEQINYPGKPLIMSLILPGAGQFYNKSPIWKTASFLSVEIGSIVAWNYFKSEAMNKKDAYQDFSDEHWSLSNWITNRFSPPIHTHEDRSWTNFSALTSLRGTHDLNLIISGNLANELNLTRVSSDSLEAHPDWISTGDVVVVRDRHFYENIGKYDQFLGGWSDAGDAWYWEEKDVGDSIEIVIKTPLKSNYIDQRYSANQMLNAAKYSITALMFNHVISGIESVWTNQRNANSQKKEEDSESIDTKLSLLYDPINPFGVGGLSLKVNF